MGEIYSELVSPFRFSGGNVGCLLVHGLTGTPFEMRELGQTLYENGFTVSGPLLAGHATNDWRDLANATWRDWARSVETEYQYLTAHCDRIMIVGLSMGGCLSLWLTANQKVSPTALVIMASPLFLLTPLQRILIRLLSPIFPYKRKGVSAICDPVARNSHLTGKHTVYRAVLSGDQLVTQLRPLLPQVAVPTLLVYSEKDPVVKPLNGDYMQSYLGSERKGLVWLHNSWHIVTRDYDKQLVFDRVLSCARQVRDSATIQV